MSKDKDKKKIHTIDRTKDAKKSEEKVQANGQAQPNIDAILAGLSPEARTALLRRLQDENKKKFDPTKGLFDAATKNLCEQIQNLLGVEKFPAPFSVEFGRDTEGNYFCHTTHVRPKYGPRGKKEEQPVQPQEPAPVQSN